jgi:hypothetical protein
VKPGGPLAAQPMPAETQIALYRGLLAERTAECAALAEALDAVTHEPEITVFHNRCEVVLKTGFCARPADDPVHRTSARVRAELGIAR